MKQLAQAIGAALGAAYGGRLGVTATSGPGVALKSETLGLAVSLEIPLILVDIQRGGPSTGLPTKTEASDLMLAMYGRHGEAPLPIVAASTPADCVDAAIEAARAMGFDVEGPIPPDTAFLPDKRRATDLFVCMYHDQGHIPVKVYGFEESITANLGLPFVRTSVDHGTAFDIAGKGVASHESMLESIRLAVALAQGNGLSGF